MSALIQTILSEHPLVGAFYYGTTLLVAESILGMIFAHVGVAFVCQEDNLHYMLHATIHIMQEI